MAIKESKDRVPDSLAELQALRQERDDLELSLAATIEHGDAIAAQLATANAQLQAEILERRTIESNLRSMIETISRNKEDLEALILTITEHSDQLDTQWLSLYRESERNARHDPLTGLANRRHLDETLETEWSRSRRCGTSLAVLMCDIDFFKIYNDSYGHPAGDECLKRVASVLTAAAGRDSDSVVRYGGEEFTLLLPNTDKAGAIRVAQDILDCLARLALPFKESPIADVVTLSIGLAVTVADGGNCLGLIAEADRYLYTSKQRGRNRVTYKGQDGE